MVSSILGGIDQIFYKPMPSKCYIGNTVVQLVFSTRCSLGNKATYRYVEETAERDTKVYIHCSYKDYIFNVQIYVIVYLTFR